MPPKVRIEETVDDPQENADILVIGGTVQAAVPLPVNFIIQPMVTFYPDILRTVVACEKAGCEGHFKFGMYKDKNLPVEFGNHDKDAPYYFARIKKAVLPMKVPNTRGRLVDGLKWFTATPRDGQIGLRMTCMIDGFLTDLKVRTLDIDFCSNCLFISKDGDGRRIERVIRTIMHYIYAVAKPEPGPDGIYQVVRNFTYEQQLFIKRIWIDRIYDDFELKEESTIVRVNGVEKEVKFNNLLYDPVNLQELMETRKSMFRFVVYNLRPVSWYHADLYCGCYGDTGRNFQVLRFMATRTTVGVHVSTEAGFFTFNPTSLEFDDDYWEAGGAERDNFFTANSRRNLSRKVQGTICQVCDQMFHVDNFSIPETTWILIVECPMVYRFKLKHTMLPPAIIMSGATFELAWISFMKDSNHYVSIHLIGGYWYFYDDISEHTSSRTCPFNRLDGNWFNLHRMDYTLERCFYIRVASKDPHRCLELANAEETS